mmetsp:Transcript_11696/g.39962  ORF Transcript_11696/g.39962 Transcript_11696/m.39962 type:complete len:292 (-) Transcript_11696:1556-2431(-)
MPLSGGRPSPASPTDPAALSALEAWPFLTGSLPGPPPAVPRGGTVGGGATRCGWAAAGTALLGGRALAAAERSSRLAARCDPPASWPPSVWRGRGTGGDSEGPWMTMRGAPAGGAQRPPRRRDGGELRGEAGGGEVMTFALLPPLAAAEPAVPAGGGVVSSEPSEPSGAGRLTHGRRAAAARIRRGALLERRRVCPLTGAVTRHGPEPGATSAEHHAGTPWAARTPASLSRQAATSSTAAAAAPLAPSAGPSANCRRADGPGAPAQSSARCASERTGSPSRDSSMWPRRCS